MDYWDVFRSLLQQLTHEDDLLVARTLWLVLSQPLLLLIYFLIDRSRLTLVVQTNPYRLVGVLGILSTIFIYSAILAAELEFVALRAQMAQLTMAHADLPMRRLPSVGIGSGLLCPILLSLLILYVWVLLTSASHWVATLMVASGVLFAIFFVGEAQGLASGEIAATLIGASLPAAFAALVMALLIWVVSRRV